MTRRRRPGKRSINRNDPRYKTFPIEDSLGRVQNRRIRKDHIHRYKQNGDAYRKRDSEEIAVEEAYASRIESQTGNYVKALFTIHGTETGKEASKGSLEWDASIEVVLGADRLTDFEAHLWSVREQVVGLPSKMVIGRERVEPTDESPGIQSFKFFLRGERLGQAETQVEPFLDDFDFEPRGASGPVSTERFNPYLSIKRSLRDSEGRWRDPLTGRFSYDPKLLK